MQTRRTAIGLALAGAALPTAARAGASGSSPSSAPGRQPRQAPGEAVTTPREGIVRTSLGPVRGFRRGDIYLFRGVPYGADPSGAARFQPPSPPKPWSDVRSTLAYGPACPQPPRDWGNDEMAFVADWNDGHPSENCLTLNVWTLHPQSGEKRPVLVWLHGGGFTTGSSYELPGYEGSRLAAKDLVVVSVNHRLGVLGFLDLSGHGEAYARSGNAGMLDIELALKWVRDNIAAFGGDPGNVTIAGQSGGGAKVSALMAMPSARGLFHRAVVMSGSIAPGQSREAARAYTSAVFDELKLAQSDVGGLLKLPADVLVAAGTRAIAKFATPGIPGLSRDKLRARGWGPVADGDVLPVGAWEQEAPALSKDIPLLVGNVRDEFKLSAMVFDRAGLEGLASRVWGERAPQMIAAVDGACPNLSDNEKAGVLSGVQFHNAAVDQALMKARQGGAPAFAYWFTYNPRSLLDGRLGVPHCADIAYFFDNAALADQQTGNTPEANRIADLASDALVRFASTGSPGSTELPWPAFSEQNRETMVFDANSLIERYPGQRVFEAARK